MSSDQNPKIVNVKSAPISKSLRKFMRWEDECAKSSFVIYNNRELPPPAENVVGSIPAGYALVPVEPTQEMIDAAEATTTLAHNFCEADLIDIYKAMVREVCASDGTNHGCKSLLHPEYVTKQEGEE